VVLFIHGKPIVLILVALRALVCSWLVAATEGCADSHGVSSSSAVAYRYTLCSNRTWLVDVGGCSGTAFCSRSPAVVQHCSSASAFYARTFRNDPQAGASSSQLDVSIAAPPFVKRYFIFTLRHSSTSCRVLLHRALGTASTRQKRRIT